MHTTMNDREKLLAVMADPDAGLEARVEAGAELARIGDHRATVVDRVLIPGGTFLYSGRTPTESDDERGQDRDRDESAPVRTKSGRVLHKVRLSAFHIDR